MLTLASDDGHLFNAYLSKEVEPARGGLVVIQDAYGVGGYIRGVCDAYAKLGYDVIAPSIYDRQEPNVVLEHGSESAEHARRLRAGLIWSDIVLDVKAALKAVSTGRKVGLLGFCVGGSVAWIAGRQLPFAAVVSYYGRDIVDHLDEPPTCPTMLHFGDNDHLIPAAEIDRVRARHPNMPIYLYPAGHGFDGPGRGHDEHSALLARDRTLQFLRDHVG